MTKISNSIAWITGASSGIGEALAIELSNQGASVVLSARREDELTKVLSKCAEGNHMILPLDVTDESLLRPAFQKVLDKYGKLDILVNNAGVTQRSIASETDISATRKIMEVNFFSAVALTRIVLPYMIERRKGHILATSSVTGKYGTPFRSTYAASKHALHGYFDSVRAENSKYDIKVTLVCPGFIKTPITLQAVTADGSPLGTFEPGNKHGIPADRCARKIAKAIKKNKREVYIAGLKESSGIVLKRLWPGLLAKMLEKISVT
ncbi:SDR family oxidoreductase [Marinigracilibium pacificum]|uniref:SDR family oxidoreductase n=1 Tax=Marinigracilibium pacificum TaxID=2729599 RepID=A0A848IQT9_9BACT|nr:SDR family oxidoreductase [Marinigracilibium pacificum]NMM46823.1 SDR family oxidoreductase [Marinigracilibium pacificum]